MPYNLLGDPFLMQASSCPGLSLSFPEHLHVLGPGWAFLSLLRGPWPQAPTPLRLNGCTRISAQSQQCPVTPTTLGAQGPGGLRAPGGLRSLAGEEGGLRGPGVLRSGSGHHGSRCPLPPAPTPKQ